MNQIIATWNPGHYVDGDSLPMCSASERDELFLVGDGWEYTLPDDWKLFQTKPASGDFMEVVGEKDGEGVLVGYACPVFYVMGGVVYKSYAECCAADDFHPNDYIVCRLQAVERTLSKQIAMLEDDCYGD